MQTEPEIQLKLQVLLTEYERIKEEIFHHKTTQQTILNFIIFLISAEIAGLLQIFLSPSQLSGRLVGYLLLVVPIPFALLSFYHSAYTIRIHKLASYLDAELREKIETIVGKGTLRVRSFYPTPNILALFKSSLDGKMTYLALFGLKALPQLLALITYLSIKVSVWNTWEFVLFVGDITLMIVSVIGQHD